MSDLDPVSGSPPLPRTGSYNIDFEALDDSVNPFESKTQLGSSPPINSSSGYNFDVDNFDDIDPFKSQGGLRSSPVGSPREPLRETPEWGTPGPGDAPTSLGDSAIPNDGQGGAELTTDEPQKKVTPKKKKVIKKSKIQSKFKPPKNFQKPESNEEIQIFAPGERTVDAPDGGDTSHQLPPPPPENNLPQIDTPLPPPPTFNGSTELDTQAYEGGDRKLRPSSLEEVAPLDPAPDEMVASWEVAGMEGYGEAKDDWSGLPATQSNGKEDVSNHEEYKYPEGGLDLSMSPKDKTSKPSTQQDSPVNHLSDDGSPAVKKSPRQVTTDVGAEKHPAARALQEAAKVNESSSDDVTFYDAPEYPPVSTSSKTMLSDSATSPSPREDGGAMIGGGSGGGLVQVVQVLRYSQSDWNKLKQELELSHQGELLSKQREWAARLGEAEESNRKLKQTNEDMRMVVAEFEKTISQLQAEKEKHKKELGQTTSALEHDRDQAVEDLQSVETAFSDLHRRYEKSKGTIEALKKNEAQLKEYVEECQNRLKNSEAKLISLRSQAEDKLDRATEDLEQARKSSRSDVARLEAALKKSELRISSLEDSLSRKEKENEELTAICDELIAKVGS